METLLICLLLLYNAWLVTYILFGRRKKTDAPPEERPQAKPPKDEGGIVGKSRFKMESRTPISAKSTPNTATSAESEDVTDVDVTFADEIPSKREQNGNEFPIMPSAASLMQKDEASPARLPDDKLDEAFTDIRISDVPQEYTQEDEQDEVPAGKYASGNSFEEIGKAVSVADNPAATKQERQRAGQIFSAMEGNDLFNRLIKSSPERARKITGLMDSFFSKPISGQGQTAEGLVQSQTITGVPADISGFDIRDFV